MFSWLGLKFELEHGILFQIHSCSKKQRQQQQQQKTRTTMNDNAITVTATATRAAQHGAHVCLKIKHVHSRVSSRDDDVDDDGFAYYAEVYFTHSLPLSRYIQREMIRKSILHGAARMGVQVYVNADFTLSHSHSHSHSLASLFVLNFHEMHVVYACGFFDCGEWQTHTQNVWMLQNTSANNVRISKLYYTHSNK